VSERKVLKLNQTNIQQKKSVIYYYIIKNMIRNNNNNNNIEVLNFERRRFILCTTSFNIQKFCCLPTIPLCILRWSQNKQRYFSLQH